MVAAHEGTPDKFVGALEVHDLILALAAPNCRHSRPSRRQFGLSEPTRQLPQKQAKTMDLKTPEINQVQHPSKKKIQ